jgi:hypothetical protein
VTVLREPTVAGIGQLAAMQTAAPSFEVELQPIDARDVGEFERVLARRKSPVRFLTPFVGFAMLQRTTIFCDAIWDCFGCVIPARFLPVFGRFEANSKVFLHRPERRRLALA